MPCLQSPLSLHLLTGVAFLKRECPCISLCPQDILAAQWLCYLNPLRFCFSPPTHCWLFCPKHTLTSRYRGSQKQDKQLCSCLQTTKLKKKKCRFLLSYLDVREEGFQHVGAGVAGVEEHELGLLQMARGETLLDVHIDVKAENRQRNLTQSYAK